MKKLLLITLSILLLGCSTESEKFKIMGTTDLDDGKKIFRVVADSNNQPIVLDTMIVSKGKFEFQGTAIEPDINFLYMEGVQGNVGFIIEPGTIKANLFKNDLASSEFKGSPSNDSYILYKNETKSIINSLNEISTEYERAIALGDDLLANDLAQQHNDVRKKVKEYEIEFIQTHKNSFFSALFLEKYLSAKDLDIEMAKVYYNNLDDKIRNTQTGNNIYNLMNVSKKIIEVGELAPRFEGPDPSGNILKMNDLLGKVTIIDFWASWCRPCRVENPNFVRIYNKFHDKGLNIVGVSLDRDKNNWIRAISDDGLVWSQVSNLKFWNDPIAKLYNVSFIPQTFILDEDGKILSTNLRGSFLERKIEEILGSQ